MVFCKQNLDIGYKTALKKSRLNIIKYGAQIKHEIKTNPRRTDGRIFGVQFL